MAAKPLPDLTVLNNLLICDAENGLLIWRQRPLAMFETPNLRACWNGRYASKPAFRTASREGYFYGMISGRRYLAHRVIWKMHTGEEPGILDHIDGDGFNNRIENLRNVSHSENMRNRFLSSNNKTGVNGVDVWQGRFRARINSGGRTYHIGMFDTLAEAKAAQKARALEFGFSDRHGT